MLLAAGALISGYDLAGIIVALPVMATVLTSSTRRVRTALHRYRLRDILLNGRPADGVLPAIPGLDERTSHLEAKQAATDIKLDTLLRRTAQLEPDGNGGHNLADKIDAALKILQGGDDGS